MPRRNKGKDPLLDKPALFDKRQKRWGHNALFGHLARAKIFVGLVLQSTTTTTDAKQIAVRLEQDLEFLGEALKIRNDSNEQ